MIFHFRRSMLWLLNVCAFFLIIPILINGFSWRVSYRPTLNRIHRRSQLDGGRLKMPPLNEDSGSARPTMPPCREDMEKYAFILANVTDCMDTRPEQALSVMTKNLGWMLARDVPKLTEMLLAEFPVLRQDEQMMKAHMQIIDFLETFVDGAVSMIRKNQALLKEILEAAKVSEKYFDQFISSRAEDLTNPDFLIYLETEIDNQEDSSPVYNLLVTIQLRLLDEKGKSFGADVMKLPKLAAIDDVLEMRREVVQHISEYDLAGKELYLQTLRIMMREMGKRYKAVDPGLVMNLEEIERIVVSEIEIEKSQRKR